MNNASVWVALADAAPPQVSVVIELTRTTNQKCSIVRPNVPIARFAESNFNTL